ncbi:Uncharacterised protein [Legionella beliardensis]|uniref:Lytic transglycosylase MltA domain-containing protein n=1 Tax=Legionella beliardensis TaxID=91822 RepID=A0A378I064_9GAMM|nr:hypothetical protein [Legionella beliardensis]STX28588.1 Uncharacterised protein [Legionella beliardensis]
MINRLFLSLSLISQATFAAPHFNITEPIPDDRYEFNGPALCETAKETIAYLNKGSAYDPEVIHAGKVIPIPLNRVKATLKFICEHQHELNNPAFIKQHFDLIRWYPDKQQTKQLATTKPLLKNLPPDQILMTKYYVPVAKAAIKPTATNALALYALPKDEQSLTLEEANAKPNLTRFQYGKQAILKGALAKQNVPALAYLSRDDLETALMQGTVIADFGRYKKFFNVHRNNNIAYNPLKSPYEQERFWYFKEVNGLQGYGKDAEYKITIKPEVTFAADLKQFGLGKLMMVQYPNRTGQIISRAGILADTGGAFENNLYQVDFLAGSYLSKESYLQATRNIPNYVAAYFMVLKETT